LRRRRARSAYQAGRPGHQAGRRTAPVPIPLYMLTRKAERLHLSPWFGAGFRWRRRSCALIRPSRRRPSRCHPAPHDHTGAERSDLGDAGGHVLVQRPSYGPISSPRVRVAVWPEHEPSGGVDLDVVRAERDAAEARVSSVRRCAHLGGWVP
jgi:hypothetical protein